MNPEKSFKQIEPIYPENKEVPLDPKELLDLFKKAKAAGNEDLRERVLDQLEKLILQKDESKGKLNLKDIGEIIKDAKEKGLILFGTPEPNRLRNLLEEGFSLDDALKTIEQERVGQEMDNKKRDKRGIAEKGYSVGPGGVVMGVKDEYDSK